MPLQLTPTREDLLVAKLAAVAILIHVLESAVPMILPGIKPGLANIIVITVLCVYGWRLAAWVSLLRVLVGSLLTATFLSPTFLLSLGGAMASLAVLWLGSRLPGRGLSALGYSVLAAMAHITGQFVLAWALFVPHPGIWRLYPLLMTLAVMLGIINGIISRKLVLQLQPHTDKPCITP